MKFASYYAGALALGLSASVAEAAQVTLDFNVADQDIFLNVPYQEDGFDYLVLTGDSQGILNSTLIEGLLRVGDTSEFTLTGGGTFSFVSFDYRSFTNGEFSDGFELLGFLNGVEVVDYGAFSTSAGSLITHFTSDTTLIDTLKLVGTGQRADAPVWDNFVFDVSMQPVPLPAGMPLLLVAIGGLGVLRARSRNT